MEFARRLASTAAKTVGVSVLLALVGCGAEPSSVEDEVEAVGDIEQDLIPSSCGATTWDTYHGRRFISEKYTWATNGSQGPTEYYDTGTCTNTFLANFEVDTALGSHLKLVVARWSEPMPTTQTQCENSRLELALYARWSYDVRIELSNTICAGSWNQYANKCRWSCADDDWEHFNSNDGSVTYSPPYGTKYDVLKNTTMVKVGMKAYDCWGVLCFPAMNTHHASASMQVF